MLNTFTLENDVALHLSNFKLCGSDDLKTFHWVHHLSVDFASLSLFFLSHFSSSLAYLQDYRANTIHTLHVTTIENSFIKEYFDQSKQDCEFYFPQPPYAYILIVWCENLEY